MKALLFINGIPPKKLPSLDEYALIACTDGAFHYLEKLNFPLHRLDFISGDFDSLKENFLKDKIIHTPDQNFTDFHKALQILKDKNITNLHVFGGSGGEQDHFLGNLSTAFHFKESMKITFFDEFGKYFFIPKSKIIKNIKGKMVSLYPFPFAKQISTSGLNWNLNNDDLEITNKIGTRNFAIDDEISIQYTEGDLLIFISKTDYNQ